MSVLIFIEEKLERKRNKKNEPRTCDIDIIDYNGESFNFGPAADQNFSVGELVLEMSKSWDKVSWKDVSLKNSGPYESSLLKLNCDKALSLLDWKAILSFEKTVSMTAWWYREFYNDPKEVYQLTASQIREYENLRNIENN